MLWFLCRNQEKKMVFIERANGTWNGWGEVYICVQRLFFFFLFFIYI